MSRFGNLKVAGTDAPISAQPRASYSPTPVQAAETIEYAGYVTQVKKFNETWAIGRIEVNGKVINIKGAAVVDLQEGSEYRLLGRIVDHPKYGPSFEVISAAPHVELDARAIKKYLVANFKGIGEKTADKMIKQIMSDGGIDALEEFRQKILNDPWDIDWSGLGREGVFEGEEDEGAGYVARDLATRFGSIQGMNRGVLRPLSSWLFKVRSQQNEKARTTNPVFDCWKLFSQDPFEAIEHVPGYGFRTADEIASTLSFQKNAPERIRALIKHAISEACNSDGHVFLTFDQVKKSVTKVDPRVDVDLAIDYGLQSGMIIVDDSAKGGPRYYTPELYEAEVTVAREFGEMMKPSAPMFKGQLTDEAIQAAFRTGKVDGHKYSLDPSQVKAVRSMLCNPSRLHILTGGPGCGKTALIETVIRLLTKATFHFCGPTGKSSKVLTSRIHATNHSSSTIHSLFEGNESGWGINSENRLAGNILVVDESSMPALELWKAIVDGMGHNMHLIMVGDPNQLPSIQAGRVLGDMITAPGVNHVHLDQVHRNSGGILDVVREVCNGKLETRDRDSVVFSHGLDEVHEDMGAIIDTYLASIGRVGIENSLLLMSRRTGKEDEPGWNTTYANALLRGILNPEGRKIPGSKLHVNDRIIIRKNMSLAQAPTATEVEAGVERTERVVNGDTGRILDFEEPKDPKKGVQRLTLKLDDGRVIEFPGDKMNTMEHSYALTVHAAQGSEYREIIEVITTGMAGFVNQNMLMTGLSRAREKLWIYGDDAALRRIAATPLPARNSALVQRISCGDEAENETPAPLPQYQRRVA